LTHPPLPAGLTRDEQRVHEETRDWFAAVEGPGVGRVSAARDPHLAADGSRLALTGIRTVSLAAPRATTIAVVDTATGELRTVGRGEHDRLPRWAPDGRLAYLSDQDGEPHRVVWTAPDDLTSVTVGPQLPGAPELLDWSPAGGRLLVVVAEPGRAAVPEGQPSWWPHVDRAQEPTGWRQCLVVDVASGQTRRISPRGLTVWEAVWAGPDAVAAVVSDGPGEEAWYSARLVLLDATGDTPPRPVTAPEVQLGRPATSPSGRRITVVESFSSDRSLVAGDLVLFDAGADAVRLDTLGTDVAHAAWRSEDVVFFVGVRGQQTVAGEVDVATGEARELWVSDGSTAGVYPQAVADADGTVFAVSEGYRWAPRVVSVRKGSERVLTDLAHLGSEHLLRAAGNIRRVHWTGADGLPLDGFLVTPPAGVASAPYPVVLDIHGGPVWTWHDQYGMRGATGPLLASRGYAVLYVNQRGGTGKGQAFARAIEHDMLGADTGDFLTAVDALAAEGVIDPARVGLTGTSYGGTMALWLITQDPRFAASVAVSGLSDWVSFHHTTSIADFDLFFLPGDPLEPGGEYARRSPLLHVDRVRTPLLTITGALDRDVPAGQSLEMHRALTMRGRISEWVLYPEEGHVVGDFPGVVDATARTIAWFERHMPSDRRTRA
jgi:dipeptidyl aminopeptidase/acylaminoacyl peptidase